MGKRRERQSEAQSLGSLKERKVKLATGLVMALLGGVISIWLI
jgi:hypothetical protein